jgi:hypothetical protein
MSRVRRGNGQSRTGCLQLPGKTDKTPFKPYCIQVGKIVGDYPLAKRGDIHLPDQPGCNFIPTEHFFRPLVLK